MRSRKMSLVIAILALVSVWATLTVWAGDPDSPGGPGDTSWYTLEDIYDRLNEGTAGTRSTFTEPVVAPGTGTMHTLNEIMGVAPEVAEADGAGVADVSSGKTFWGLTSGAWGLQTGELQAAAACTCSGTLNGTRWCDNGDGTVTDLLGYNGKGQCLVWLKNANCFGIKKWVDSSSWDDAQTASGTLKASDCGLSDGSVEGDWRLPTKSELVAITDSSGTEYVRSGIPPRPRAFTGVQSQYYWSSTTSPFGTDYAWDVNLDNGYVNDLEHKSITVCVWPVRGGQ